MGSSSTNRSRVAGASSGSVQPLALSEVGGEAGVPARAGEDRQAAVAPQRPLRRLRQAPRQLQQFLRVAGLRGAGLLEQGREDSLVAGEGAGVGAGRAHPGLRGADLQHRDADPALGAAGQRPRQPGPVAVGLEEERDRAHSVEPGHRVDPVAGVEDGLVPGRDDGVEADPAARAEGVDREVPALADQRDAALAAAAPPSPPRGEPGSRPR